MVIRCANRDLVHYANRGIIAEGYGNMSVERPFFPYGGHLPAQLKNIFFARYRHISTVIYSYSTPIAWYDAEFNVWVVPDVSYSVTTSKHQGYLWKLSEARVSIPWDASLEEYIRVAQGKMTFTKTGTVPGPFWSLD